MSAALTHGLLKSVLRAFRRWTMLLTALAGSGGLVAWGCAGGSTYPFARDARAMDGEKAIYDSDAV